MKVMFIAVCWGHWGRGHTEEVARAECRKAGGKKIDKMVIFKIESPPESEKPYISEDGMLVTVAGSTRTKIAEYHKGKRITIVSDPQE
jgi:hypothetical protein